MQNADLGQNLKDFPQSEGPPVPLGIQMSIWKQFSSALPPAWLRRALGDSPGCAVLSIELFFILTHSTRVHVPPH